MRETLAAAGILWASFGWVLGGPLEYAAPGSLPVTSTPVNVVTLPLKIRAAQDEEVSRAQASYQNSGASQGKSGAPADDEPMAAPTVLSNDSAGARTGLGITGGAGIYFLQPRFSSNPALMTIKTDQSPTGTSSLTVSGSTDFHWSTELAPRFWLGMTLGDNWMLRSNYWNFRHTPADIALTHAVDPPNTTSTVATVGSLAFVANALPLGATPDTIRVSSELRLDVFDLEGVYTITPGRWLLQGAAGLRYANLEQTYHATLANPGNPAALFMASSRDQNERTAFFGLGPTLAAEANFRLAWGFSVYTDVRGSLLFGRSRQDATHQYVGGVPAEQSFAGSGSRDGFLPITEVELGLAWSRNMGRRLRVIAKTGFAGQVWWNAGSGSVPPGASFPAIQAAALGSSALFPIASATSSNLDFLGWTATLGLQY